MGVQNGAVPPHSYGNENVFMFISCLLSCQRRACPSFNIFCCHLYLEACVKLAQPGQFLGCQFSLANCFSLIFSTHDTILQRYRAHQKSTSN